MATLACSQAANAGRRTLKPHPSNCPSEGGQAAAEPEPLAATSFHHSTAAPG